MREKVLVELYLPMAEQTYEVFIPKEILIIDLITIFLTMFSDLASVFYASDGNDTLCNLENGDIYDINLTVRKANICDGQRLMLI